ncbi:MAG: type 11 methyltransferase [Parcubacteria group bacterium Licking1014_1]|nr:MAG: type 11 methyltransferase [Parcubacteria group bacterium Licking1014_1]
MSYNYFLRSMNSFIGGIINTSKRFYVRLDNIRRIANYLRTHDIKKLHLGAGSNILEGWCNTDINPDIKTGIFLDASKKFPFADCVFDYIFSEHMIEHLEFRKGINMLKECFRVLKPGGKLRVSTPNLQYLIELYNPKKTEIQRREIIRIVNMVFPDIKIYEDVFVINNFFRNWGHKFIYDYKLFKELMEKNGFVNVVQCDVKKSNDENFRNIEAHGKFISEEINKLQTFIVEGAKI